MGSLADRPAAEQAAAITDRWRSMRKGDVVRPIIGPGLPLTAARFLGEMLEVPGVRLASVMDPEPLAGSLDRWIDWLALARNVKSGTLESVCVVATSLARGGPVAFTHSSGRVPRSRTGDEPYYVRTALEAQHVRASAAIPILFPPVEITSPDFTDKLLELGRADAQRWIDRHPRFWCSDASHDLGFDATQLDAARESSTLDELRSLRRR